MVKILAIGDVHFKVTNVPEVDIFIAKIIKLAKREEPNLIVILGDVLDTHAKLHSIPLNKAKEFIAAMKQIAYTYVLVGNHDMCLAKDTLVRMWDGSTKKSQEVAAGDELVSDRGERTTVLGTTRGSGHLYEIVQNGAENYTVNKNHVLTLKVGSHKNIFLSDDARGWEVRWLESKVESGLCAELKLETKLFKHASDAAEFLEKTVEVEEVDITVENFLQVPKNIRESLYGFRCESASWGGRGADLSSPALGTGSAIRVEPRGVGEYYGFQVDGSGRFLLSDLTVTHNCNNQQFLTTNHWMNILKEWEGLEVVDAVRTCECDGETFVMVPYVPPGRFEEALNTAGGGWKRATCIFAHQEFYGCKMGAIKSMDGDHWPESYPRVVSGHIHSKDMLQENLYYTGSAMQHAFGESEKNTVAVLEFEMGSYKVREVDLKIPRKKSISTTLKKVMEFEVPETSDTLMLSVSGVNPEEFKAFQKSKKYKELQQAGIKIKFNQRRSELLTEVAREAVTEGSDFRQILHSLIQRERNSYLTSVYEFVINQKMVSPDDVIYV